MANKKINEGENILVKVDNNNLIFIDPNSTINDGIIEERGFKQENLVMYVNLEADLVPRSILTASGEQNGGTLYSVAKGTLNFLKNNKNNSETGNDYDTNWTNAYFESTEVVDGKTGVGTGEYYQNDSTGQSFGIDSININVKGANFIPQININFIDVRGKTLFESPQNSPYSAFFHLPWPIFYLTVKGFYGKAIRYRLHMTKFTSRFNPANGNFEINTTFVGSTYAYLNDIPLSGILNAPYMFAVETETTKTFNEATGTKQKEIKKSSKGYLILKSVYDDYKSKGLIPKDFPVKTLREVLTLAKSLDKILEQQIFDQVVDMKLFAGVKEFETRISEFEQSIRAWSQTNLSSESITKNGIEYNYLVGTSSDKSTDKKLKDPNVPGTLARLIKNHSENLVNSHLFTEKYKLQYSKEFSKTTFNFVNIIANKGVDKYYENLGGFYGVKIKTLLKDIFDIQAAFVTQRDKLEQKVEEKMNQIIKDPTKGGLGFEPTIRNIFAVILANADVYVRLLKDVHQRAFDQAENRRELLKGFSDEVPNDKKKGSIYPWPEIKKQTSDGKHKVVAYPGDPDLQQKLRSYDKILWPEIDFVEQFQAIATKRIDTNSTQEGGIGSINYIFEENSQENKVKKISTGLQVGFSNPYLDKSIAAILYEIWERGRYSTLIDSFDTNANINLANVEFENISLLLEEDYDIIQILNTIKSDENTTAINKFKSYLLSFSPHERFAYYNDKIPTTPYIKNFIDKSFEVEPNYGPNKKIDTDSSYTSGLTKNLGSYVVEDYRMNIYPFNSSHYLSYLNKTKWDKNDMELKSIFDVRTSQGLIKSPINPTMWVKDNYVKNIFSQKFNIIEQSTNGIDSVVSSTNVLNTPYFHKQLHSDFNKKITTGKYAGSAYLLLNSLPFYDLEDMVNVGLNSTRLSTLFREIGATHYIPYHLVLKWGSIYHRYKRQLLDGVDILNGFTSSNVTQPIDRNLMYDTTTGTSFNIVADSTNGKSTYNVNGTNKKDIGVHPLYDAIFHQVVNGYNHYTVDTNSTYQTNSGNGTINSRVRQKYESRYWTTFVDNSIETQGVDNYYTLLPSDGGNDINNLDYKQIDLTFPITTPTSLSYDSKEQNNFRIIWENELTNIEFSGRTFSSTVEYNRTFVSGSTRDSFDNLYGLKRTGSQFRKVTDLIATFSPSILDEFENCFLDFASEKLNEEVPYKKFPSYSVTQKIKGVDTVTEFYEVKYDKFQDLLKAIVTIDKDSNNDTTSVIDMIEKLKTKQQTKLETITKQILTTDNLLKVTIGNPKEIDSHVLFGFTGFDEYTTFKYNTYDSAQNTTENQNLIKLYVGEDVDGYYSNFFQNLNIELSEENILQFRSLILIYSGYRKNGGTNTKTAFQQYLKDNIITPADNRFNSYLTQLIPKLQTLKIIETRNQETKLNGYNDIPLKLEQYNYFKSFNDKWSSGNSIGQRGLLEEFLFLDKANKDIGSKAYLSLEKLLPLEDSKNDKANLYGVISMLIQGTGFDMRGLPAYINFYGTNLSSKAKLTPSSKIAENVFGTFLDVDYQESSPKIIIQYQGPTSKHLDLSDINEKYKFADDSGNLFSGLNSPLLITAPEVFTTGDLSKTNKVVAFEVSVGDQNQGIFKSVTLDQTSIKNTTESFGVMENLGRSESGAGTYQIDIGLFDIYRQSSYSCEVTMLGNVMIQPTMYFYLKNIPMFRGSYWITEVSHKIQSGNIVTTFKGSRIPYASLPDPKDSFLSSYRALFERISQKAVARTNEENNRLDGPTKNEITVTTNQGIQTVDLGGKILTGEVLVQETGVDQNLGVAYNGFNGEKYVQKITDANKNTWFRAIVTTMGGKDNPLDKTVDMNVVSKLTKNSFGDPITINPNKITWGDIEGLSKTKQFFATKFQIGSVSPNDIVKNYFEFKNPNLKTPKIVKVTPSYQLNISLGARTVEGPVSVGPGVDGFGIAMSIKLMKDLGLYNGDVVYFRKG